MPFEETPEFPLGLTASPEAVNRERHANIAGITAGEGGPLQAGYESDTAGSRAAASSGTSGPEWRPCELRWPWLDRTGRAFTLLVGRSAFQPLLPATPLTACFRSQSEVRDWVNNPPEGCRLVQSDSLHVWTIGG